VGYLAHAHEASVRDTAAEQAPDIRQTAATRAALTRALDALPPGPIRALAQTDIERAYGNLAEGTWSAPQELPASQDADAEQAISRFQRVLQAIEDGSAENLEQAVEAYAQSLAHLPDHRRDQVERAIMQWRSGHL
jgi:hypothetical protein